MATTTFEYKTYDELCEETCNFELFQESLKLANLYYFVKDYFKALCDYEKDPSFTNSWRVQELEHFGKNNAWMYFDTNGEYAMRRVKNFFEKNPDRERFAFPKLQTILDEIKEDK